MAITNLYPNLPAHLVEFEDGNLRLQSETGIVTDTSLLILGTATDGPLMNPVPVTQDNLKTQFGTDVDENMRPNGATIPKYAKQAFKLGFEDVRCMRVTGSNARIELKKQSQAKIITHEGIETANLNPTLHDITLVSTSDTGLTDIVDYDVNLKYSYTTAQLSTPQGVQANIAEDSSITVGIDLATGNMTWPKYSIRINSVPYGREWVVDYERNASNEAKKVKHNTATIADTTYDDTNGNTIVIPGYPTSATERVDYSNTLSYPWADTVTKAKGIFVLLKSGTTTLVEGTDYDVVVDSTSAKIEVKPSLGLTDDIVTKAYFFSYEFDASISVGTPLVSKNDPYPSGSADPFVEFNYDKVHITNGNYALKVERRNSSDQWVEDIDSSMYSVSPDAGSYVEGDTVTVTLHTANPVYTIGTDSIKVILTYETEEYEYDSFFVESLNAGSIYNESRVVVQAVELPDDASDPNNTSTHEGRRISFIKPESKAVTNGVRVISVTSDTCPTLADLIDWMTANSNNDTFTVYGNNPLLDIATLEINNDIASNPAPDLVDDGEALSGGADGLNPTNNEMFYALTGRRYTSTEAKDGVNSEFVGAMKDESQGAFQLLENYQVDYMFPAGIYADSPLAYEARERADGSLDGYFLPSDPYGNFPQGKTPPFAWVYPFQYQLAIACAAITYRTKMCIGFIDVKPNTNTSLLGVQRYVNHLMAYENNHYMLQSDGTPYKRDDGTYIDIGWYTNLIVGPEPIMTSDTLGRYYASPAISYMALSAKLKPQSAPTNKPIPDATGMKFRFSNKQMDMLTENRMVTFKNKNSNGSAATLQPFVVDAMTSGQNDCDYRRLSTVRIVTDVVDQVREVCDPFIGEPNTQEQRNAMSALVSKRLSNLMGQGELLKYNAEVMATNTQVINGECQIALELWVPMELRKITTVVSLRGVV